MVEIHDAFWVALPCKGGNGKKNDIEWNSVLKLVLQPNVLRIGTLPGKVNCRLKLRVKGRVGICPRPLQRILGLPWGLLLQGQDLNISPRNHPGVMWSTSLSHLIPNCFQYGGAATLLRVLTRYNFKPFVSKRPSCALGPVESSGLLPCQLV